MKAYIKAISYYLPENVLTNEMLVKEFPEWSVEKIAKKIGVKERHIAGENETAKDMAVKAALKLFDEYSIEKEQIDYLLFCTQSPDYYLPTSACLIQHELRLSKNIGALDYNQGCSGYVYGLSLAKGLISGQIAKNVLLLTAETYSKHLHNRDKGNRSIFGDAATATLVTTEGVAEIGDFILGTDGAGANNLIVKTGGLRIRNKRNDLHFDENNNPVSSDYLYMNGSEIFNFTIDNIPSLVDNILCKNRIEKSDINLFVFHQANKYIISYLRDLMEMEKEKCYINMEDMGNTVSSSIPVALYNAQNENGLHGHILIAGFGVGYSWGGTILNFVDKWE
jgi:3-oxoacyl-[acyl-carrier-protein] synthase-3